MKDYAYGKGDVRVYRTGARPLTGVAPIPESGFTGRPGGLLAVNVEVIVRGEAFLAACTDGDNRHVVATDSMKNFIQRNAAVYEGATLEGFLHFVGHRFLERYPQMESVALTGRELPFEPVDDLLLRRRSGESAAAAVTLARTGGTIVLVDHSAGLLDLRLVKLRGSSFAGFLRDEYTTLAEAHDRALFVHLGIHWRYAVPVESLGEEPARYVAAEQVRDLAQAVFRACDSRSIQELIHQIGQRMLQRFPQLAEVRIDAENRTWEMVAEGTPGVRVYTDPRPPYGIIHLTMCPEGEAGALWPEI
jgi:urate oxidase/2-oxo-4-hydroxy-4-carboxy-5-ureidoimidazoline decarboxylase